MITISRELARASIFALSISCSTAPPGGHVLENARRYRESGELERALWHTELAMQRHPWEPNEEEISLHLGLLRELDRGEEADAFAEFVERYAAGQDTDASETVPTRDECLKLERVRSKTTKLIREYGDLPIHNRFPIGDLSAIYEIDAEGRPIEIRVLRARHPASAWLVIHSIAHAKVSISRVRSRAPERFPMPHCLYWAYESGRRPTWIPPRMGGR